MIFAVMSDSGDPIIEPRKAAKRSVSYHARSCAGKCSLRVKVFEEVSAAGSTPS